MKNENKIVLYTTDTGNVTVDVRYDNETFWLTQKAIAELFEVDRSVITKHLSNIFETDELDKNSVCAFFAHTAADGKNYNTQFYNLDAIIAVGYRVNSKKATKFRQWATKTLAEYIKKGFVLNDDMLKNGRPFGKDYFDELLERIREIRASERRAYQKIADIFEQCSSDYNNKAEETKLFYAIVQNKLHFAITGQTAAEIIYDRADSEKPFMGLTTWKNSPDGKVLKSDVKVAKNYLNQKELDRLNRLVTMYIDYAEFQALNETVMEMKDWLAQTNEFLTYNKQQILDTAGKISHDLAIAKAEKEYEKYRVLQDQQYISEFDKELEIYLKGKQD